MHFFPFSVSEMHLDLALEREENKAREEQLVEQLQESKGFENRQNDRKKGGGTGRRTR